jgi:hypothetical protein
MSTGTTPPEVRNLLNEVLKDYKGKDIFIYSSLNTDKKYYIEKKKNRPEMSLQVLEQDYKFNELSEVKAYRVNKDVPNHYKQLYMSAKVDYTEGGDFGIMFTVDDKVFGFASISKMLSTNERAFIQSDFVVNSNQSRLSKLVIILLKSEEIRRLINKEFKHYYVGLKTSVFTDKPVSMKYRGPFKKTASDKGKIVYEANYNKLSIDKNYKEWLRKLQV